MSTLPHRRLPPFAHHRRQNQQMQYQVCKYSEEDVIDHDTKFLISHENLFRRHNEIDHTQGYQSSNELRKDMMNLDLLNDDTDEGKRAKKREMNIQISHLLQILLEHYILDKELLLDSEFTVTSGKDMLAAL